MPRRPGRGHPAATPVPCGSRPLTRLLITGADGYLGSRLAVDLSTGPDFFVRAVVRYDRDYPPADERVELDLLGGPGVLADLCEGVDAAIHFAAPNEALFAEDPDGCFADTVIISRRLADAAAAAGVRRFVYLSTIHVYGNAMAEGATVTEETPAAPLQGYAIARLASEHLVRAAAAAHGGGMDVIVFRPTNILGATGHPRVERWTLLANDLCRQAALNGTLKMRTHGMQWRDFVAISDASRTFQAALESDRIPTGTYNLGAGKSITCRELAQLVQATAERLMGEEVPLEVPDPPADPPGPYQISVERLARLGLKPERPVASAIEEMMRFCLDHRAEL